MRVWRVAHSEAREGGFPSGPYSRVGIPSETVARLWHMAGDHSNGSHPSPFADPELRGIGRHERCGFNSREALNDWFDGWTEALSECGFAVHVYDVPDWAARVGMRGQVVFAADEAVEVERYEFKPEQLSVF